MGYDYGWRPYVSVGQRRRRAAMEITKLKKSGRLISPVEIEGRKIAKTFWGESWCENLEAYSDYENRLPRGRTYVRNGSVMDLQIEAGRIRALVSGSSFYDVDIKITPLAKKRWGKIKTQCAGRIDSMVELLQGSISKGVMEIVTRRGEGLFPSPKEISLSCSCPDWATMCKHVAATLYGVGARLDHEPEMLFTLRGVEPAEMIAAAVSDAPKARKKGRGRILKTDDVSSVFGIELDMETGADSEEVLAPTRRKRKKSTTKASTRKATQVRAGAGGQKATSRTKTTKKKSASAKSAASKVTVRKSAATKSRKPTTRKVASKKAGMTKIGTRITTGRKVGSKKNSSRTAARKKTVTKKVVKKTVTKKVAKRAAKRASSTRVSKAQ